MWVVGGACKGSLYGWLVVHVRAPLYGWLVVHVRAPCMGGWWYM